MLRASNVLLILLITFFSALAAYKEVSFVDASIEETKMMLAQSDKYSLIYFMADWCLPCQVLQEGHLRDERVIDYVNYSFISVKADYSEKSDIEWYDAFEIRMLPTLLIMDENGDEVDRIQNIRDTRQLLDFLRLYSKSNLSTEKPLAYKLEPDYTPLSKRKTETTNSEHESIPKAILASNNDSKDIYAIEALNRESDLSIQFGAYNRYEHALRYMKKLNGVGIQTSILEEYVHARKYYKVIQRASKDKIHQLYDRYQAEGRDCFIRPARIKS